MDTNALTSAADGLSAELDAQLASLARSDSWRMDHQLKRSAFETTDIVFFEGARGGELGPFVRKHIDCSAGVGSAYEQLWHAQRSGTYLDSAPRLVECVRSGDDLTVVMEYISGPTLQHLVEHEGASREFAGLLFPRLCDAVSELHERLDPPLIHRDLKPSNIIVRDGSPVIIDFGIARVWRDGAETDTAHFGTRAYAPPEQFGFGQTDVRSDIYALGKLLYFCLMGEEPPHVIEARELAGRGVDPRLVKVIARATAFDPDQRFGSARELGCAVRDVLSERDACSVDPGKRKVPDSRHVRPDGQDRQMPDFPSASPANAEKLSSRRVARPHGLSTRLWHIWNVALIAFYALLALGCVVTIADPSGRDFLLPLWLRIMQYGSLLIMFGALELIMLKKDALMGKLAVLGRMNLKRLRVVCVIVIAASIVVFGIAGELAPIA